MRCFFDTNVLVYFHDASDSRKQQLAREAVREQMLGGGFVISTQVLQEFCAAVQKRRLLTPALALAAATELARHAVRATTAEAVLTGVALAQRHQLSIWDGLIVQAALDAGCTTLLTEDLHHGQRFGVLQVVNPFLPSAHEPSPPTYRAARRGATRKT
jgi:predicted nucleic acid-binding protein